MLIFVRMQNCVKSPMDTCFPVQNIQIIFLFSSKVHKREEAAEQSVCSMSLAVSRISDQSSTRVCPGRREKAAGNIPAALSVSKKSMSFRASAHRNYGMIATGNRNNCRFAARSATGVGIPRLMKNLSIFTPKS